MENTSVKIKYVKSHDFRSFNATGVYGGVTVNGFINANFFTDRAYIPEYQTIELNPDGVSINTVDVKEADSAKK